MDTYSQTHTNPDSEITSAPAQTAPDTIPEVDGELLPLQLLVIRYQCSGCHEEMFLQGPPLGSPEMIQSFMTAGAIKAQCPKCNALMKVRRSMVEKAATLPGMPSNAIPINRQARRAAKAGAQLVRLK